MSAETLPPSPRRAIRRATLVVSVVWALVVAACSSGPSTPPSSPSNDPNHQDRALEAAMPPSLAGAAASEVVSYRSSGALRQALGSDLVRSLEAVELVPAAYARATYQRAGEPAWTLTAVRTREGEQLSMVRVIAGVFGGPGSGPPRPLILEGRPVVVSAPGTGATPTVFLVSGTTVFWFFSEPGDFVREALQKLP